MNPTKSVLLVEDDKIDVMTIRRIFKELNIQNPLTVASNGEEALDLLMQGSTQNFSVILLDLNMPRMSGIEFLTVVKSNDHFRHIPIVVLTTSNHEDDIQQAYDLSVEGYMVKPVDYDQFVEMMKNIHGYWTTSA
ncbi:MAG: response regulator [Anaerolineae bacterium]|jgi:CheY-like chemotaxis protein|nr:MAG: response regulator [Anaerolineae bacterium]